MDEYRFEPRDYSFEWELEQPEGKPHIWKCLCWDCREWLFAQPLDFGDLDG